VQGVIDMVQPQEIVALGRLVQSVLYKRRIRHAPLAHPAYFIRMGGPRASGYDSWRRKIIKLSEGVRHAEGEKEETQSRPTGVRIRAGKRRRNTKHD
jgi:hypothetical protein